MYFENVEFLLPKNYRFKNSLFGIKFYKHTKTMTIYNQLLVAYYFELFEQEKDSKYISAILKLIFKNNIATKALCYFKIFNKRKLRYFKIITKEIITSFFSILENKTIKKELGFTEQSNGKNKQTDKEQSNWIIEAIRLFNIESKFDLNCLVLTLYAHKKDERRRLELETQINKLVAMIGNTDKKGFNKIDKALSKFFQPINNEPIVQQISFDDLPKAMRDKMSFKGGLMENMKPHRK